MNIKNFTFGMLLAGAVLLPASLGFGAERQWGSVEGTQYLSTPQIRSKAANLEIYLSDKTLEADVAADGINIITGDSYQINNTSVLNATTLGAGITGSSLTSHGNQTSKMFLSPAGVQLGVNAPLATATAGGTGNVWSVHQYDADGGATGDDHVSIPWHVPDGYVVDSARLNIMWSCESAETTGDQVMMDLTLLAVGSGEAADSTVTAYTAISDTQWTGVADLLFTTQLNFEVATIAVDDMVYLDFFIDESLSSFTDTIDIHGYEIEWESTES